MVQPSRLPVQTPKQAGRLHHKADFPPVAMDGPGGMRSNRKERRTKTSAGRRMEYSQAVSQVGTGRDRAIA